MIAAIKLKLNSLNSQWPSKFPQQNHTWSAKIMSYNWLNKSRENPHAVRFCVALEGKVKTQWAVLKLRWLEQWLIQSIKPPNGNNQYHWNVFITRVQELNESPRDLSFYLQFDRTLNMHANLNNTVASNYPHCFSLLVVFFVRILQKREIFFFWNFIAFAK